MHYSNIIHREALGAALRLSCLLLSSREVTRSLKDFSSSKRMNTGEKVGPRCCCSALQVTLLSPQEQGGRFPASGWGAGGHGPPFTRDRFVFLLHSRLRSRTPSSDVYGELLFVTPRIHICCFGS